MIKVEFNNKRIKISGHANFNSYGNDIVCASVSSIVYTTVNGLLNLDKESIKFIDNKEMIIDILKDNEVIRVFINNMLDLLKDLAEQYPKNISVKENKDVIY